MCSLSLRMPGGLKESCRGSSNRIVMNLPLAGTAFLPEAFRLVRPGARSISIRWFQRKASTWIVSGSWAGHP